MANGWLPSQGAALIEVINPATGLVGCQCAARHHRRCGEGDRRRAGCFPGFQQLERDRLALLGRIRDVYERRLDEIAEAISTEMGAPLAIEDQAGRVSAISRQQ
jgi:aldehyde dehydrogenase (NAD+)